MNWSYGFLSPWWLALLVVLPAVIWQAKGSLSGLGTVRKWMAIVLRSLVLALLVFALADFQFVRKSDLLCTLFVLDQSQSMPQDKSDAALQFISSAIKSRQHDADRTGLVVFGKNARIELPPAEYPRDRVIRSVGSMIDRQYSDISSGIKLALGSFPPDTARRIVLISDGNQNRGNVLAQALNAKQNGVPIDVVPIEYRYDDEILVDKIDLPNDLKKGDTANLKIVIRSSKPAAGLVRLNRVSETETKTLLEQRVQLRQGLNVLVHRQTIDEPDFYTYEAKFEPDANAGDRLASNNLASAFTWVRGSGRILLIEPTNNSQAQLVQKLKADNIQVTQRLPEQVRANLAELRQYDSIVIANVPAESLGNEVQEAIAANTKEMGSGLMMIGGPDSFGAGGYQGTPIEKALPVDMEIKATKIRGKGALVLIMHACEIPEGNFWQKEIARLAIRMLGSQDECGLVYWSGTASWLFTLQPVGDKSMMMNRIDRMSPGDMPNFEPTMTMALNALTKVQAMTKHVIVISDGDPQPPSSALLQLYKSARISCTAVSIASHGSVEKNTMSMIARGTGGRFYEVTNPKTLPQIYIKETRIVSRPLIYERAETWQPLIYQPTEVVAGMPRALPAIRGLVLTTPKPTAEVAVVSPIPQESGVNPILAHWQYGLGKAVAFTTDTGKLWAVGWPQSELYGKFFSQVIRWSMRSAESENLTVSTQEKDGKVTVVVNALDKSNDFLNFLKLKGSTINPEMKSKDLEFRQTEPGKYEAEVTAEEYGNYLLRIGYSQPDGKTGFISTGLTVSYPPEYRDTESNRDLMENVASVANGRVIPFDDAGKTNFFPHDQPPTLRMQEFWPYLLLFALAGFLADVGVRRIAIDPKDVATRARQAWAWMRRKQLTAPAAATMERLRVRKAAVGEAIEQKKKFEADPNVVVRPLDLGPKVDDAESKPMPPTPEPSLAPEPEKDDGHMGRLLKAKKKVWDKRE